MQHVIGKVLGKRYHIVERLGEGGMGAVYRAQDVFLDRSVAVKVLHHQFSGDEDFLRRFRREAHAAARLSHANVVSIYDMGQEGDDYYLVLEHVEGQTLKEHIRQAGRLSLPAAIGYALAILDALTHAHANGIIHRDIKPHNILLSADGRLKMTDFGLAGQKTADTLTNSGAMIGSAHYFAPEVAQGHPADEQTDLYALGCVLYEMLTGQVPFNGDSPISVALKHVQEDPVRPGILEPGLPAELEAIVLQAMAKDPRERFASAAEMAAALRRFAEDLRAGRTVPGAATDFPTQDLRQVRQRREQEAAALDPSRQTLAPNPPRRGWRWGVWLLTAVFVAVLSGIGYAAWILVNYLEVPEVEVPNVVGRPLGEAQQILAAQKLTPQVVGEGEFSDLPANYVVAMRNHQPGDVVRAERPIELVLSKGPRTIAVPELTGMPQVDAENLISQSHLRLRDVKAVYDRTVPAGLVIRQVPAVGASARENQPVDIWVSKGPNLVPGVVGLTRAAAERRLAEQGMQVGEVDRIPSPEPKDTVVAQQPAPGAPVETGAKVNLTLSLGTPVAKLHETTKTIQVRGAQGYVEVQVLLSDDAGKNTPLYKVYRQAGDSFPLTVRWAGDSGKLTVLVAGSFSYDIPLP